MSDRIAELQDDVNDWLQIAESHHHMSIRCSELAALLAIVRAADAMRNSIPEWTPHVLRDYDAARHKMEE